MMKRIDNLLIKAHQLARGGMELVLAMVMPEGDSWAAVAHLWDGIPGHTGRTDTTTHTTTAAAVEHVRALAAEYPSSRDVHIIIDDLGG